MNWKKILKTGLFLVAALSLFVLLFRSQTIYMYHGGGGDDNTDVVHRDQVERGIPVPVCQPTKVAQISCPTPPRGEYVLRDLTSMEEVKSLVGPSTSWDDPRLVTLIRDSLLEKRRPFGQKLSFPLYQTSQAKAVDAIFQRKRNGFFVECGALDGERSSNTIWLERQRSWTGLLVEMDPSYYLQLRGKNRHAYTTNLCISPEKHPIIVNFKEHERGSGALQKNNAPGIPTFCVPFYSMMLAMNRTQIDYFSLDVEGFEMPILRSIPFDKLDIKVFTVEYVHGEPKEVYTDFMASKGYKVHSMIDFDKPELNLWIHDFVFVKET